MIYIHSSNNTSFTLYEKIKPQFGMPFEFNMNALDGLLIHCFLGDHETRSLFIFKYPNDYKLSYIEKTK